MSIEVLRAGVLTTVQDFGRHGMQRFGVPVGGAMDAYSLHVANLLVGNDGEAAALEVTLAGARFSFDTDTLIAICGGDLAPTVGDRLLPMRKPVWIARGSNLTFKRGVTGTRAYIAVAGGIDVPIVLGSRSTYIRAAIGGVEGRALRGGDRLAVVATQEQRFADLRDRKAFGLDGFAAPLWSVHTNARQFLRKPQSIRFVAGRHWESLNQIGRTTFVNERFRVSTASDRMGYRLEGVRLEGEDRGSIHSEAVAFGTIQLPPDGNPIVLMADRQTIGGYPRLGEVASVDLSLLAQLKPGDVLTFSKISLAEAQQLLHLQNRALVQIKESIRMRLQQ